MSRKQAILGLINIVASQLGARLDTFVFVGGAAAALLINDPSAGDVRPTDDVDLVVDIETYREYQDLVEKLRRFHGFEHVINGPLCRFSVQGVTVDVMPTEESVLRFCNKWYGAVVEHATRMRLPSGVTIRVVSAPVFLCTKLEAFADRGKDDYFGSSTWRISSP